MLIWPLWLVPAFEAGFWTSLLGLRGRKQAHVREVLLHGSKARIALPFIDRSFENAAQGRFTSKRFRMLAGAPTRRQIFLASRISAIVRWFTNTRIFENLVLIAIKANWRHADSNIDSRIDLCL